MADSASTDSPLEVAAGAAGPRAIEAFSILGNETRLSILLALWEAFEPFADDNTVPFSDLRDRVGMRDSGQFNYHLNKLAGHFIRKTDNGYELRTAGKQFVRTVIAGTGIEEPKLEQPEMDIECSRCGAPTSITYQEGILWHICTECEADVEYKETQPSGTITGLPFDPAGLSNRTPEEMLTASVIRIRHRTQSAVEGVCDVCSGPTEISLHICEEHDSDGVCDTCGRRDAFESRHRCLVCKLGTHGAPSFLLAWHPDVVAFYNERGVPIQYEFGLYQSFEDLVGQTEQELVSEEPPKVRVTYEYEGDRLEVLVDEEMNVLEVTKPD